MRPSLLDRFKSFTAVVFVLCVALGIGGVLTRAGAPGIINYQGRVSVNGADFTGQGLFKFALINASGTATYWGNDGTSTTANEPVNAVSITVNKGLYSVVLGDTSLTNMTVIPAGVFSNQDVRLRIWFSDGANGSQLLIPDQRIAATGYAFVANVADTVSDGGITTLKIADGAVTNAKIASVDYSKISNPPTAFPPNGNAGGDLAGSYPIPTIGLNAVTTAKIADGAVTASKIANGVIPSSFPPTGNAGGDLTGTYPNPTIGANKIDATKLASDAAIDANRAVTTNHLRDGAVTAAKIAGGVIPTSLPPTGSAGGDLTGTYPNPTIAAVPPAKIGEFPKCKVVSTVAQSLPAAVTVLTFNSENYDTDSIHDNAVNNSRLTAKTSGYYSVTLNLKSQGGVSNNNWPLYIRLNGSTTLASTAQLALSSANGMRVASFSTTVFLNVNDYVETVSDSSATGDSQMTIPAETFFMMNKLP